LALVVAKQSKAENNQDDNDRRPEDGDDSKNVFHIFLPLTIKPSGRQHACEFVTFV
jgi:hypothetical protein